MLHPTAPLIQAMYNFRYFDHTAESDGIDGVNLEACHSANHKVIKNLHHSVMLTLCFCFVSLFVIHHISWTGYPCRMANLLIQLLFYLHLDEYKCNVKWYNACLTVPFNWKGQNLHNSRLKGSQRGWHYKHLPLKVLPHCSALLSVYPNSLLLENRPFLTVP